jgi:translation initiation factor IF-3
LIFSFLVPRSRCSGRTGADCFGTIFIFRRCSPIATNQKDTLINEEINCEQIRVIGTDGAMLGIMSSDQALQMAYDKSLDLVMMSPDATPPVCKIMDYGKYRFEKDKREKEAKKKQQVIETKEIQLSCNIGDHDFQTKLNHAFRFLKEGNKVKVCVRFKGREMRHTELGMDIIMKFAEAASEYAQIDKKPVLEGRNLTLLLVPIKQ